MRVLWLCNIMLPVVAEHLHREASSKEGWLTGLSSRILQEQSENKLVLGVCFPVQAGLSDFRQCLKMENGASLYAYGFYERTDQAEQYDASMEERFRTVLKDFKPDAVHCFGTEYPHTLAMIRAFSRPERTLIGIQGLCAVYAGAYRADLPGRVWRRSTFRDLLRHDSLRQQQKKYEVRGIFEKEAVKLTGHVTGRTAWDRKYMQEWNPEAEYHFMNETLRPEFYEGKWKLETCRRHSIFLSQGDYPIKGLHYILRAMPEILKTYPDTEVYVAGNSIIKTASQNGLSGIKGRWKLDSYGKYIYDLLRHYKLTKKVHFLGKCDKTRMKELYLEANVFLCPSSIENSPNSVGEAMLLGVPVVCADVGGISSIFQSGQDGILYPSGDVKELTRAVKEMFTGGEAVCRMTAAERVHARITHDPDTNYLRLLDIYQTIISKTSTPGSTV